MTALIGCYLEMTMGAAKQPTCCHLASVRDGMCTCSSAVRVWWLR